MQDFVVSTETVKWGTKDSQTLEVRGLSFQDFTVLFTQYGKSVDSIFQFVESVQNPGSVSDFNAKEFGDGLLIHAPQAVATVIALAIDMPDRVTQVARMPLPVQLRCLEAIYKLTIEEAGGLEDFLAFVLRLAKNVSGAAKSMTGQMRAINTGT